MKNQIVLITLLSAILAAPAMAGHHESLMPPAKAGQIVVTYKGACPAEAVDGAVAKIRETIAYERANSPVVYASSPGVWADGRIGAVDLHASKEAMDKAFAWQAADATWTASFNAIAASCGITVEDFVISIFNAR
ncbi:hypothetical protein OAB85_02445 [Pseudomonadales bacterium]|nr:hypothetical protein [Pseudomonadales bacterium]